MPLKYRLKVLLAEKGMTQKELSEATGIRAPTISAICVGSVKQFPVSAIEKSVKCWIANRGISWNTSPMKNNF